MKVKKVRYIGPDLVAMKKDKIYDVLVEKHGTYKVMTELDETYYVPEECFEEVEEDDDFIASEEITKSTCAERDLHEKEHRHYPR